MKVATPGSPQWRRCLDAYHAVFRAFEPFGTPFQDQLVHRLLLLTGGLSMLERDQLDALRSATGSRWAWVCVGEPEETENAVALPLCWSDYEEAADKRGWAFVPHAIFPPDGRWGVITDDENRASAAGDRAMVEGLGRLSSASEGAVRTWLDGWAENQARHPEETDVAGWIPAHLAHLFGPERAQTLLAGTSFARI